MAERNDLPSGFKMTDIGPLPEPWRIARMSEVVRFTRKPRGLQLPNDYIPFIPMELIPAGEITIRKWIPKRPGDIRSGIYCERGDILLPKITPSFENGKQGIIDDIPTPFAYATTEVFPLQSNPEILDKMFLFFYLLRPVVRAEIAGRMEGTTGRQRIPKAVIKDYVVPLPPLLEQRAIARVLTAVRRAIEATEAVIEAVQALKKSLMQHLFTYGPVPVDQIDQVPLKETEIGLVPEKWKVRPLNDIAEVTRGISWRKTDEHPNGIPVIGIPNIQRGRVAYDIKYRINKRISEAKIVREGDILLVGSSGSVHNVGRTAIVRENPFDRLAFASFLAKLSPRDVALDNQFLYYLIQSSMVDFPACSKRAADGKYNLHVRLLQAWQVPLPPMSKQRAIALILQAVDTKIKAEQDRKSALAALFDSLLHHLMTGQVRVPRSMWDGSSDG